MLRCGIERKPDWKCMLGGCDRNWSGAHWVAMLNSWGCDLSRPRSRAQYQKALKGALLLAGDLRSKRYPTLVLRRGGMVQYSLNTPSPTADPPLWMRCLGWTMTALGLAIVYGEPGAWLTLLE